MFIMYLNKENNISKLKSELNTLSKYNSELILAQMCSIEEI